MIFTGKSLLKYRMANPVLRYRSLLAVRLIVNEPKSLLIFAWFLTSYSLSKTSVAKYFG